MKTVNRDKIAKSYLCIFITPCNLEVYVKKVFKPFEKNRIIVLKLFTVHLCELHIRQKDNYNTYIEMGLICT